MRWWERDPWIELAQVLLRNPFRTFLSSLGVGWGLFMILITVGASNGLEEGVKSDMGNRVKNSAFLWGESTTLPYKATPGVDGLNSQAPTWNTSWRMPPRLTPWRLETSSAVGAEGTT